MEKICWKDWNPGLSNGDMTLKEVHDSLPGNNQQEINIMVRIFESPKSPIAFRGAVSLERHDYIHILLGRGLLPQDEAFVLGFTMGTAPHITKLETTLFKIASKHFYPSPYNFTDDHLKVFDLAVEAAKKSGVRKLYKQPLENHQDNTVAQVWSDVGLDMEYLKDVYRQEQELMPNTLESQRLDV